MTTFKEYFEQRINETEEHFYGVDSETEKRAAGSDKYWGTDKFASSDILVAKMKKYYFKPEVLEKLCPKGVQLKKNSKRSFNIFAKTKFEIEEIKPILISVFEKVQSGEGVFGVNINFMGDNRIFVEFNVDKGINFKKEN